MIFIYIFPLDGSSLVKIPTAAKRGLISWWPCLHGSHKLRQKFAVVAKGSKGVKWRDKWGALVYMTADSRGHKESRPTANTLMTGSSLKALQVSTWVAQCFTQLMFYTAIDRPIKIEAFPQTFWITPTGN